MSFRRMRAGAAIALVAALLGAIPAPETAAAPPVRAQATLSSAARVSTLALGAMSLDEIRLQIDLTSKDLRVASGELALAQSTLQASENAASELRVETAEMAEDTLRAAIEGYQHSEIPPTILTAADVNAGLRADALTGAAVSADVEGFDAYRTLLKDLEIAEDELAAQTALVEAAQVEVALLEDQLAEELILFGELEERRIQDLAAGVTIQATNRAQARGRKQGFYLDTCPVDGPHSFIDSWGFARSGGRRHEGVDILASIGTPIVAPVSGVVEHRSNRVGGRSFHLNGDDGNYFYGTHLSGYGASGVVRAGEVIGYVGDDGNAAGIPHLHFEIHPGGRRNPINPYIDVAAVCSGAE